jgi:hypothetical protein
VQPLEDILSMTFSLLKPPLCLLKPETLFFYFSFRQPMLHWAFFKDKWSFWKIFLRERKIGLGVFKGKMVYLTEEKIFHLTK